MAKCINLVTECLLPKIDVTETTMDCSAEKRTSSHGTLSMLCNNYHVNLIHHRCSMQQIRCHSGPKKGAKYGFVLYTVSSKVYT